jgi:hypothetical protein
MRAPDQEGITRAADEMAKEINWLSPDVMALADYISWWRMRIAVEAASASNDDSAQKLAGKMGALRELIAFIDLHHEAAKRGPIAN